MKTVPGISVLLSLLLGACTTLPPGPSAMALPGTGKSFDQFRADDAECKAFAQSEVGRTPEQAAIESGARTAALGTALGAVAGAAIGGGRGAAVGAATGLALGGVAGAGAADTSSRGLQYRYDAAFQQCMYAKGDRVPVAAGRFMTMQPLAMPRLTAAPMASVPPPPPGSPPFPPPR